MVDVHLMEGLDAHQQVQPDLSGMFLTELLLAFEHVVVEVETAWEALGHDVVVGLRFEKVYYPDHLGDLARLLQRQHLRLVLQE